MVQWSGISKMGLFIAGLRIDGSGGGGSTGPIRKTNWEQVPIGAWLVNVVVTEPILEWEIPTLTHVRLGE